MYLSLDPVPAETKILHWWKMHEKQLPLIAYVARQILCSSATSTPSERAFNKTGNLIT